MPRISVVIITLNEENNILRCLESVKPFADEIIVVDSMSTDNTIKICTDFGCKVHHREFTGYSSQKQFAVDQAVNDWVFSIDADEVVSAELQKEILEIFSEHANTGMAGPEQPAAYRFRRSLHFMGKLMHFSGVRNEYHIRLFNRKKGGFKPVTVHEAIEVTGYTGTLSGRFIHYSYRDISHHLEKINTYTSLAAEGNKKRGKSFSKIWVALKFPVSFFSFYFIKLGFLDGYPGFMWSFLAAVYSSLKIAKTIESTGRT